MRRVLFLLIAFSLSACSSTEHADPDVHDVQSAPDLGSDDGSATHDADHGVDADDPDATPMQPTRVPLDLEPYLEGIEPVQGARAFVATTRDDLVQGGGARGRVGDYVLENDRARFVIQQGDRFMSPCSHSGNIIDAAYLGPESAGDVLGEICLFLNVDQTFLPEHYEILHDGSEGYAVVAVTGRTALLDFLNIKSMIATRVGEGLADRLQARPDGLMPMSMTIYYLLLPGELGVRVFTAMRNDSTEQLDIVVAYLIVTDGDGDFFNPLSSLGGFGSAGGDLLALQPDRVPFLAYLADRASFAYMPRPNPILRADLPAGGSTITISGVAAVMVGVPDLLNTLLSSREELSRREGVLHIGPGEIDVAEHRLFVGDGALSTMVDVIYETLEVDTGNLSGRVVDSSGAAVSRAYVSAIDEKDRTWNQTRAGVDGIFSMALPGGDYTLVARLDGQVSTSPTPATITAGDDTQIGNLEITLPALLDVVVRTPDGRATPARITVLCDGPCPNKPTSQEEDTEFDRLPGHFGAVGWVGVSGDQQVSLPPGDYRVVVSRGMEWSVWPSDAPQNGGFPVRLEEGATIALEAEIARVIDSTGHLSGDFHVHAIASADSNVPEEDRVRTFLAEGIDVIVSTDHDTISDFGPAVEALDAGAEIVSVIGSEITTSDLGHFNAFPLAVNSAHRRGGGLDWGDGESMALPPAKIFDWIRSIPGEQVIQVNHPNSSYLRFSDVLRGLTYGDPVPMRVQSSSYDADTNINDLWSEDFTAMELMNGHDLPRFWAVSRWWLTLIGRGLK
ncbi:MAG: carboxypeptidase regulatory-like domain-containing protein, partial [Bradymonadaceae bacterium]